MTRDRRIGYIVLLFLMSALLGCAVYKQMSIMISMSVCERSPERVLASEEGRYCVMWANTSELSGVYIQGSVARIPEDVVIYGLKSFFGFSGKEMEFEKIVSGIVKGVEMKGSVFIYAFKPKSIYASITYSKEQKHLVFQDLGQAGQKVVGAIDLSDVDVTLKPEDSSMSFELRELDSLLDDGIITEYEFQEQKKKMLNLSLYWCIYMVKGGTLP